MEQHIILCGLGRVGWHVFEYLRAAGLPVVIIDTECPADESRLGGTRLIKGDCGRREVLEEAGLSRARGVLLMIDDDLLNISTALAIRQMNAELRIVMRLFNQDLIARLGKAVTNVFALSTERLTAPLFAMTALTGQALGRIRLDEADLDVRQVAATVVTPGSPGESVTLKKVAADHEMQVLAHRPRGGPARVLLEVDCDARLQAGDRLTICGPPHKIAPLLEEHEQTLRGVLWAGWLRRLTRVLWRTVADVDLAVKICAGIFFAVVLISTLVLHFGVEKYHWSLAFFRTISLMATGGDMHPEDFIEDWQKVYVSVLRIAGAALTAAFTAILTNYLLRARLGGALEFRRIPDSGHIVVVGLGNIGYRVVRELVREGARVVVVEKMRDGRFVTTTRRLGVPVLIGDAAVAGVLRQAHAAHARAVIVATSNDLANLEIALLVRDLNPTQRVVLRLSDADLAKTLSEAANIRLALSIPALAAPSFVAALFGDRVQNVFLIEGRMLAAVDLLVPPHDFCLSGQSVRAVAIDYGLVPVAVFDPEGRSVPAAQAVRLDTGFRLVAVCSLTDLQRLLRREPVPQEFAVDVTGFPMPARSWVVSLLRVQQGLSAEAAEKGLDVLPLRLNTNLTRGQAEDLLAILQRERVTGSIIRTKES
jgi:Trk K+ transport system NAD-binding subunit